MKTITFLTALGFATSVFATNNEPHNPINTNATAISSSAASSTADARTSVVTTQSPDQRNSVSVAVTGNPVDLNSIKNTPNTYSAPLTSSFDTCLGSASGSVSAPGFGLSLGTTQLDKNCVNRKNMDMLNRMGMRDAALALACEEEPAIKKALEATGYKCP